MDTYVLERLFDGLGSRNVDYASQLLREFEGNPYNFDGFGEWCEYNLFSIGKDVKSLFNIDLVAFVMEWFVSEIIFVIKDLTRDNYILDYDDISVYANYTDSHINVSVSAYERILEAKDEDGNLIKENPIVDAFLRRFTDYIGD